MQKSTKRTARRHRSAEKSSNAALPTLLKSILIALPIALAVGLLLLLLCTALLLTTKDPDRYHDIAGLAVLYLTALLSGMLTTVLHGRRTPLVCGLVSGGCLLLLFSLPALFVRDNEITNVGIALLLRALLLPAATAGAVLLTKKRKKRRR